MPRKQPPPGYITAGEAARILQVTDAMLTIYVRQGKLKRYGPETRKHKFYKLSEVEKLAEADRAFFEPEAEVASSSEGLVFHKATLADLEAEGYLAYLCFGPRASDTMPARRAFLTHNPDMCRGN